MDGSLKLPSGSVIPADDVTLPEGIKLSSYLNPTGELPIPAVTMPDGSMPSKKFSFKMPDVSSALPDFGVPSFNWKAGMKIPAGSQLPDGKPVPEGAEPQPGGSVLLPGGLKVPSADITLPEGIKLTSVLNPTGEIPTPGAAMPDGSKPAKKFSFSLPQFSAPSMPGVSLPSFRWGLGFKIPEGSQLPGGEPVPEGAEPQMDGSLFHAQCIDSFYNNVSVPYIGLEWQHIDPHGNTNRSSCYQYTLATD